MPTKQEVLSAIASGELFTPEYQERERQRKAAVLLERKKRQAETNALHSEQSASLKPKPKPVDAEFNPYAGKKSGDYVGD